MEVEPASDVGDDICARELFLHELDLSLQVVFLLVGADAAVADCFCFSVVFLVVFLVALEVGVDVIEALSGGVSVVGDFALVGIGPQGIGVQPEDCGCLPAWEVGHGGVRYLS